MELSKVKENSGRRVKYLSTGREFLRRASDRGQLTLTGSISTTGAGSIQVAYVDPVVGSGTDWVGARFLELFGAPKHEAVINELTAQRNALQLQVEGIDTAIKALENL